VWRRFRTVIGLQMLATIIAASIAAWIAGVHGALSATLGGLIGVIAGVVFALLAARSAESKGKSAGEMLFAALRAEAAKLFLAISLLWLVLATYHAAVVLALIGSFVASILIFSMALFAGDET
jgi:ATP synthase protein I